MFQSRPLLFSLALLLIIIFATSAGYLKGLGSNGLYTHKNHYVLVSISPYKYFIEKIAKDTVTVDVIVPEGASAHTYEPTPKQLLQKVNADAWFIMGEFFEKPFIEAIRRQNPSLSVFDLREGVDVIEEGHYHNGHFHASIDPHIWLSPRQALIQAETIKKGLTELYPEYRAFYQTNFEKFAAELVHLDKKLTKEFSELKHPIILVSHPAYQYMARDYGFTELSIEFEGKEPSPKQLAGLLEKAKERGITHVFIQPQYNTKGARLVAEALNGEIVMLNPYNYDYQENILSIARKFKDANKVQRD